eukprot:scaffold22468_cov68-Phaeocystis_antarctica.AAC.2
MIWLGSMPMCTSASASNTCAMIVGCAFVQVCATPVSSTNDMGVGAGGVPSSGGAQVVQASQAESNWHSCGFNATSHIEMDL